MKYILSFTVDKEIRVLEQKKFLWFFYRKAKIISKPINKRICITIKENNEDVLGFFNSELFSEFLKQVFDNPRHLQLENEDISTSYLELQQTNFIKNSI